jgi:hypothetical protein
MLEVFESVPMLSTTIPLDDPALLPGSAVALELLLTPGEVKNAAAGGQVPPGLMLGLAALVTLIP